MSISEAAIFLIILMILEMAYFKLAGKLGIMDKPGNRTMHEGQTIRGGGIVFYLGVLLYHLFNPVFSWYFIFAVSLLAVVSFVDDLKNLPSLWRFFIQFFSVSLIAYDTGYFSMYPVTGIILIIVFTGVLNAYNFMDGINGMTGGYSLVTVVVLWFINQYHLAFIKGEFLIAMALALVVFNFFNFRKKAICFAGDIGAMTIAFIIIYALLNLMYITKNPIWILFLTIYGIDTVITILQRLRVGENIFVAHRMHLYQIGIYKGGWSHLRMSTTYALVQLCINIIIIWAVFYTDQIMILWLTGILILLSATVVYVYLKFFLLRTTQTKS
ncbi:UDP-GlcNAc--UDP-phosphate GlcNAc-1-phosphate transferase [Bacteroidota bacterium]